MSPKKDTEKGPELDMDDVELWEEVTLSVTPLGARPKAALPKRRRPQIRRRDENDFDELESRIDELENIQAQLIAGIRWNNMLAWFAVFGVIIIADKLFF